MGVQIQPPAFKIRTVTCFARLALREDEWEALIHHAGAFLARAQRHFNHLGFEVQSLRLATQPLSEFLPPGASAIAGAQRLQALANAHGITLLSLGPTNRPADLPHLPHLIASTQGVHCSYALPSECSWEEAGQVADTILNIADATGGEGGFRFAAAAGCPPGIPFFPVAYCPPSPETTSSDDRTDRGGSGAGDARGGVVGFALGTESDAMLHEFTVLVAQWGAAPALLAPHGRQRRAFQAAAGQPDAAPRALHAHMLRHLSPLEEAARQLEAAPGGCPYLGIDTSIAPGLDTPTMTASYELLGLGPFGGPGTLAISARITQVLKALPLKLVGYCGLMLAVLEDEGLAAAATRGALTVSDLLSWSAVCGCGLDTVPVPGRSGDAVADAALRTAVAAVLLDVRTLASRLSKPLAARLLPLPGAAPGEATAFANPHLIKFACPATGVASIHRSADTLSVSVAVG